MEEELERAIDRLRMRVVRKARGGSEKKLQAGIANLQKHFGIGSVGLLSSLEKTKGPCFSTGYQDIDDIITGETRREDGRQVTLYGTGRGLPRGRIIEIFGPESCGKTTWCLHVVAAAQARGERVAYIDAEHAIDFEYAERLGCDTSAWIWSQPDTAEQALNVVEGIVDAGLVDVVVVDSVAAMTPEAEVEGDVGDYHVGLHARLMSQALRKLTAKVAKSKATVIFINQTRSKIGVKFGNPETTTGGNALRFYASVRLRISNAGQIKEKGKSVGSRSKLRVVKNKVSVPFREVYCDLRDGKGIVQTHKKLASGSGGSAADGDD